MNYKWMFLILFIIGVGAQKKTKQNTSVERFLLHLKLTFFKKQTNKQKAGTLTNLLYRQPIDLDESVGEGRERERKKIQCKNFSFE